MKGIKMDTDRILYYLMIAAASLISITLHECAHGYVALRLGDPTARNSGRLTLNPIKHIDPLGLMMLIILKIGYAKPVPVNPVYFSDRKKGMRMVSFAGPLTNLLLAFAAGRTAVTIMDHASGYSDLLYYLVMFLLIFTQLNIGYGVFNLLPFPPLDGSKIFASLLPVKWEAMFYRYQKYFYIVVIALYLLGGLDVIIDPVISFIYKLILF